MAMIIALIGIPGAGKTTLARSLAERVPSSVIVSRDEIRSKMFPRLRYTLDEKTAATEATALASEVSARRGENVIVDGMTFSRAGELERFAGIAARFIPFMCHIPVQIAAQRIKRDMEAKRHCSTDRIPSLAYRCARAFREIPDGIHALDMTREAGVIAESALLVIESGYRWPQQPQHR